MPVPDLLGEPYWTGVAQGRFVLPRCSDCGRFHFYPKPACPWCRSAAIEWAPASGRGHVYSYSVVYRAPAAAFGDEVPYVIVIVETDEGPHLMSRLIGMDPAAVRVGLRVRVRIDTVGGNPGMPMFEPDAGASGGDDGR
ncbi:MAG: Zn-ribbon domain-containing OB-fold protein [Lautropia sp.]